VVCVFVCLCALYWVFLFCGWGVVVCGQRDLYDMVERWWYVYCEIGRGSRGDKKASYPKKASVGNPPRVDSIALFIMYFSVDALQATRWPYLRRVIHRTREKAMNYFSTGRSLGIRMWPSGKGSKRTNHWRVGRDCKGANIKRSNKVPGRGGHQVGHFIDCEVVASV